MSVSIALIPVALAMRVVMGKENFENWVESHQIKVTTTFNNELEIYQSVKKAGYDVEKYGSFLKTHLKNKKEFFFWERIEGKWVAIFANELGKEKIRQFMSDVELVNGKKLFNQATQYDESQQSRHYPTNFRDKTVLLKTLNEFGIQAQAQSDGRITCRLQESTLIFSPNDNGLYHVEIINAPSAEQAYLYLNHIDDEYKRCVQTATYEKIKKQAQQKNLAIKNEKILADKTIVITLTID